MMQAITFRPSLWVLHSSSTLSYPQIRYQCLPVRVQYPHSFLVDRFPDPNVSSVDPPPSQLCSSSSSEALYPLYWYLRIISLHGQAFGCRMRPLSTAHPLRGRSLFFANPLLIELGLPSLRHAPQLPARDNSSSCCPVLNTLGRTVNKSKRSGPIAHKAQPKYLGPIQPYSSS